MGKNQHEAFRKELSGYNIYISVDVHVWELIRCGMGTISDWSLSRDARRGTVWDVG